MNKIDIDKVAELAKIKLNDDQKIKFTSQLEGILDLFNEINKVNTDEVEETSQVTGLYNVATPDSVTSGDESCGVRQNNILRNTPKKKDNLIAVPKVIGDN